MGVLQYISCLSDYVSFVMPLAGLAVQRLWSSKAPKFSGFVVQRLCSSEALQLRGFIVQIEAP